MGGNRWRLETTIDRFRLRWLKPLFLLMTITLLLTAVTIALADSALILASLLDSSSDNNLSIDSVAVADMTEIIVEDKNYSQGVSFQSILYGVLFAFFCFYLFVGLRLRRNSQIYFVAYIFSVIILVIFRDYSLMGWLIDRSIAAPAQLSMPWVGLLVVSMHVLFIISYLKSRTTQPIVYRLLFVLISISSAIAILMLFGFEYISRIVLLGIHALFSVLALSAVSYGIKQKIPGAKYLFVAVFCGVAGFMIGEFVINGLLPSNQYSEQAVVIGVVAEVLLFAFCLADKLAIGHQQHRDLLKSALKSKNNELKAYEQSSKLKNQFLAAISHELRTPMNGVVAAIDILTPDNPDSREREKYLQLANSSAEEMTRLLDKLLSFAELQSGVIRAKELQFNISELVVGLCERYEARAQIKGINLQAVVSGGGEYCVLGDAKKLREIINQLLDNAVKFTDHGSVVVRLNVSAYGDGLMAAISVSDTGVGIHCGDKQRVFNAFEQQDSGCDRRYSGLGIGLSICQQLANIMGGKISYQSEEVIGCTFELLLPLKRGVRPLVEPKPDLVRYIKTRVEPILIVEDNHVNQLVLKGMLTKLGYEVLTADNGIEALSVMDNYAVSIVLMDCQMPEMDGFEATKRIRAGYEAGADVPIIAVTANAMEFDTERCIAVGMNDFIKKPVRKKILMKKLLYWLNKRPAAKNNVEL